MGETCEGRREGEDMEEVLEGPVDDRADNQGKSYDNCGVGSRSRNWERGIERVRRRGVRDVERAGSSGERSEIPKETVSEQSSRIRKKGGQRKADGSWDDSEEGRPSGRGKRSREGERRDRSRGKQRGEGNCHEDSDDGSEVPGRWGEDSRTCRPQIRSRASEEWGECDGATRLTSRLRTEPTEDDRIVRRLLRDSTDFGREESEDGFQRGRRGRDGKEEGDWIETPAIGGEERCADVLEESGRFRVRARDEMETDKVGKQRDVVGRERSEGSKVVPDNGGRLGGRGRGNGDKHEKLKARDGSDDGRDGSEDRGKAAGRRRGGKPVKEPRISDGRKSNDGNWADTEWDWVDDEDFEQDRASDRTERHKDRQKNFEREIGHEVDNEGPWERERLRERDEVADRPNDRMRNKYREGDDKVGESGPDLDRKKERVSRSGREKIDRGINNRERKEREKVEDLSGHNGIVLVNESSGRGIVGGHLPVVVDPCGGILCGLSLTRAGGDSGGPSGEFTNGTGEADREGSIQEESGRGTDDCFNDHRERHTTDDDRAGLEQGLGPSPGRGGGNDGGMAFNLHGGRGRAKISPSNRSRGAMIVHENRPNFVNNQGTGLMIRGIHAGGKGGRGGRGLGKVGRGSGRDGQRTNLNVVTQLGPGVTGPHFGQLPPVPIGGLGLGIMVPGAFPLPPFGGCMGWSGGDMNMMNGPQGPVPGHPRFVSGIGPGPPSLGPSMFFNSPGPVRGGPGAISLGAMFGGSAPFGGRPMPGERGPSGGRSTARGGGPAGRGPSRGEQNDYSQHFVDTGLRPQNFIRDVELADRFEEYPKLKELIARKDKLIAERATPPMYMQCDLRNTELRPEVFGTKFDVILVDPPWEEYVRRAPGVGDSMEWWSHSDIQSLRIEAISDTPAFIFLWVGDAEGLDQGRVCLKKWGFRRCEDICWVKTNRENPTPALRHDANTVLQHSKEHCLMGIKGTVRRSTDGHIIHANVDTDIIISEESDYGSTAKPEELYHIIEHFAQGQRRIELFGEDHNIRAGWVTVGKGLSSSNFSPQTYAKHFSDGEGKVWQGGRGNPPCDAPHLVGTTSEIESLRPKSPPPRAQQQPQIHAANIVPPSGTNGNGRRMPSTAQGSLLNGTPIPSLGQGIVQATPIPVEAGLVGSIGRAGSHGQIAKLVETVIAHDTKVSGTHHGNGSDKVANEELNLSMVVEALCEVKDGANAYMSKPAPFEPISECLRYGSMGG